MSQSTLPLIPQPRRRARSGARAWPTLAQVWLLMVPMLVAMKVLLTPIAPYDFWWHLAYGRSIVQTGQIPAIDIWSWTRHGVAYFDQPWLAQAIMYVVYHLTGAAGTQILQAILVAGAYWLMGSAIEAAGVNRRLAALVTLLAAVGAHDNWHVRPQSFALPLWIATIALLDDWRRTGKTPWLLIPMLALWSNLHGTWTLPLVLGGAFVAGETLRARHVLLPRLFGGTHAGASTTRSLREIALLVATLALAALATLLNPRGWSVWVYTFNLLGNRAVTTLVTEWAKPEWGSTSGFIVFALFMLMLAAVLWRRREVTATDLLVLLPFALISLQAVRNIMWFAALAPIILAPLIQQSAKRAAPKRIEAIALNRTILALLALMIGLSLPWFKGYLALPENITALVDPDTPLAAVPRMQALPQRPTRLFHDMGYGSYLIWAAPEQRVFTDPRIEHYPYTQWRDYIQLGNGKRVDELVARYGIDGFLLHEEHQEGLIEVLRADPRWQLEFAVDDALLFLPTEN